jgi:HEAT repeats
MSDKGNHPEVRAVERRGRVRGSGPILIIAVLFVVATFLAWYFTWFGRELSDTDIAKYLSDEKNPRHVQHALLQIQQRIERGDGNARSWYPQLIVLSGSAETEFRLTVAWLMGSDNHSQEFHEALLKLLQDQEPIVRRNAALALVRFNDPSGRQELAAILKPYAVKAAAEGSVASTLHDGSDVARGTLLARIQESEGKVVELRSPLPGRINKIEKVNGSQVKIHEELLSLNADEGSVWEALRALSLIGGSEDLAVVQGYVASSTVSPRIREQAASTAKAIQNRTQPQ